MSRRFSRRTRLLSFLLSAAMVCTFLPVAAFAASGSSVRVGGSVWMDSATRTLNLGEGTATYDPDTNTLTLENATIECNTAAIYTTDLDLTVVLKGENQITATGAIYGTGNITVTGEGSLNATCTGDGSANAIIASNQENNKLTVDNTHVTVESSSCTVWVDGDVEVLGSTFKVTSTDGNAIYAIGDYTATNSTVTLVGSYYPALWTGGTKDNGTTVAGSIVIEGGSMDATCEDSDAVGTNGTMKISGCSVVSNGYYTALYAKNGMELSGGTITANGINYGILSDAGLTITNVTDLKATAENYCGIYAHGATVIDGSVVEAVSNDGESEEAYAIQVNPHYGSDDDDAEIDAEGTLLIKNGSKVSAKGTQGIMAASKTTLEDAHLVIDSKEWSIDMPTVCADGYDIAYARGGSSQQDAALFDWYSMSLESSTPNTPGTFAYLELKTGAVHDLTVTDGSIKVNGKLLSGTTAKVAAGSKVALTADDEAFTEDAPFQQWSITPSPADCSEKTAKEVTFTMPASDVTAIAQSGDPINPDPSEPGGNDDSSDAAVIVGSVALIGLTGFGVYEIGTELYLRSILPEGSSIPTTRGELALLLWNAADRPEPAAQPAFTDVPDTDLAKAAQWCVESGLMTSGREDAFAPAKRVFKWDVIKAWQSAANR